MHDTIRLQTVPTNAEFCGCRIVLVSHAASSREEEPAKQFCGAEF